MKRSDIKAKTIVFGLSLMVGSVGGVRAQDAGELQKLETAVHQLQGQNQELYQQLNDLKGLSTSNATVAADLGYTPAKYVVPGYPDKKLSLGGYVQANAEFGDVAAYEGQFAKPAAGSLSSTYDKFRLRRARIGGWGDLSQDFDFKIMGDFAQGDGLNNSRTAFSATDVFINWHTLPEANIKFGQFDTPFGMEQFEIPDMMTLTPERSEVTEALRPERQVGVMLWGKPLANIMPEQKDLIAYYLGIFNGDNRNINVNDNNDFMYMGRVDFMPVKGEFLGQPTSWILGLDGYSTKDATNTVDTQTGSDWVQKDGSLKSMVVQTALGDKRTAGGVDQRFNCGPLTVQAEYLQTKYENTLTADPNFTAKGYWALIGYQIIPKTLELVGKYEYFRPDQMPNDDLTTYTAGINWYIKGRDITMMLDYMNTKSHFREMNPSFGPDDFNEVMLRMQFNF